MRLGLLGGTFDPIHNGHLRLAIEAKEQLGLDRVVLEVAASSPFKMTSPCAPGETRYELAQLAANSSSGLAVGRTELDREPPSYTVDTLAQYEGDELFLILGADAARAFGDWKDPERIMSLATLAVGCRPGTDPAVLPAGLGGANNGVTTFHIPLLDISSTMLRDRLAQGKSIRYLTPDSVIQSIEERRLYR